MKRLLVVLCVLALPASALAASKIERVWKSKCSSCHGAEGKADSEKGKKLKLSDMSTAEYQKKQSDAQLKKAIVEGVKNERDGVKLEMDAYADLKPEQVDELVALIRTFGKK